MNNSQVSIKAHQLRNLLDGFSADEEVTIIIEDGDYGPLEKEILEQRDLESVKTIEVSITGTTIAFGDIKFLRGKVINTFPEKLSKS